MKISNIIGIAVISSMAFAPYAYAEYSTTVTTPAAGAVTTTTTTPSNGIAANSSDALIAAKIKGLFVREEIFGKKDTSSPMAISVETKDGVVTLTGTAKDPKQLAQAVTLAKSVDGVKDVKSMVTIHDGVTTITSNSSAPGNTTTTSTAY